MARSGAVPAAALCLLAAAGPGWGFHQQLQVPALCGVPTPAAARAGCAARPALAVRSIVASGPGLGPAAVVRRGRAGRGGGGAPRPWGRLRASAADGDVEWEDISGDGGCLKQVVAAGGGREDERPRKGSIVHLHYDMSVDGQPLDSSRGDGRDAFEFELGLEPSDSIAGWERAVPTMRQGERARLRFAPAYAFGEAGAPPKIPPNATIDCTLELLSWVDKTAKWSALADQYTGGDVPEEEIYEKYKEDIKSGDQKGMVKDFNIDKTPGGKEREVYALDDVRLKKLAAPNQKIGGKYKNYKWTETEQMMDLFVFLPEGTRAADVEVAIKRDQLRVALKGSEAAPLLEGPLVGIVRASECWWVVAEEGGQPCVHAQLPKMPPDDKLWAAVVRE